MSDKTIAKKRSSNIELLRIICTFMVISLHMLNPAVIGGIKYAKASGSVPAHFATSMLFCFSITAVDIFILISGYFMINNYKRKIGKAINLFFVCAAYSVIKYVASTLWAGDPIKTDSFIYSFFPKSYYVFLYCTLYIISPYINRIVSSMSKQAYRRMLIVFFVLFSLWPTVIDCYRLLNGRNISEVFTIARDGNGSGFTLINFIFMYLIGGYLKKFPITFNKKSSKYSELLIALGCCLINCLLTMFFPKINGTGGILGYETVFVVIQAVAMFDFFTKIDIGSSSFINFIAKSSFGIFLLHTTVIRMMGKFVNIPSMFKGGFISSMMCYFILLIGSFLISAAFDIIAHLVMTPVSKWWSKTKLFSFDPSKEDKP